MTFIEMHEAVTPFLGLVLLLGSCGTSAQVPFETQQWKVAAPSQRREMAKDFLKRYRTNDLLVDEIKVLLGEPDYEDDNYCYSIGTSGSDSSNASSAQRIPRDLELCVSFRGGFSVDVGTTYTTKLTEDAQFNSSKWKASNPSEKIRMVRNLLASGLLLKKSKPEVIEILGEAEHKSDNVEIGYDLGPRVIDHVYLIFVVGPDRKILNAEINEK